LELLGKSLTVRGDGRSQEPRTRQKIRHRRPGRRQTQTVIAKTFPLEQIVEAHRFLESNQQIGKIVVTV
jgi:NADPH:quinone reductase-like Zn-dependent oxidoreductase